MSHAVKWPSCAGHGGQHGHGWLQPIYAIAVRSGFGAMFISIFTVWVDVASVNRGFVCS